MGGRSVDEDDGAEEGNDEESDRGGKNDDSFFPGGDFGILLVHLGGVGVAGEEDEEEQHAGCMSVCRQVDI